MGIKGTVDTPGKAVVLVEVGVTDMRVVQTVVSIAAFSASLQRKTPTLDRLIFTF